MPLTTRAAEFCKLVKDCMQGKVFTEVFIQYGRRVSRVRVTVRVSVKMRVRFRFVCVGNPTCSHSLAV